MCHGYDTLAKEEKLRTFLKKENPKPTALKWHTSFTKYNLSQIDKTIQIFNKITALQSRSKNSENIEMEAK